MKVVARIEFESELYREGSWIQPKIEGMHACTMEFFVGDGTERYGQIEFDIPSLEEIEHIGNWWNEAMEMTDYDGVHCLPHQAVGLLEKFGLTGVAEFV